MGFSIERSIKAGWEIFKSRPLFFIGAVIVIVVASMVVNLIAGVADGVINGAPTAMPDGTPEPRPLASLISWLLGFLVSMGATAFFLKAYDDPQGVTLGALWHPESFLNYFLAYVLVSIVVGIGFILLIIPGVILALMFMFATVVVIDRGLGAIDAMKASKEITSGHKWGLLGFVIVLAIVNIIGALALGIGLLVTIPVTALAYMDAYRSLGGGAGVRQLDARL